MVSLIESPSQTMSAYARSANSLRNIRVIGGTGTQKTAAHARSGGEGFYADLFPETRASGTQSPKLPVPVPNCLSPTLRPNCLSPVKKRKKERISHRHGARVKEGTKPKFAGSLPIDGWRTAETFDCGVKASTRPSRAQPSGPEQSIAFPGRSSHLNSDRTGVPTRPRLPPPPNEQTRTPDLRRNLRSVGAISRKIRPRRGTNHVTRFYQRRPYTNRSQARLESWRHWGPRLDVLRKNGHLGCPTDRRHQR